MGMILILKSVLWSIDMELTAYSVKLRKTVKIVNPKIVTLKNGRKAVQGFADEDPTSKVFRILGNKEVAEVEKQIG
ncbi:MAG: hypothetical protein ACJ0BE_06380 [Dehalococcoidia bacterium]